MLRLFSYRILGKIMANSPDFGSLKLRAQLMMAVC